MKFSRTAPASFTLVEILVVVSIIGLLAGLSIPAVGGALASARKAKVSAMAHQIRTALVQFNTEYGFYPTSNISQSTGIGTTQPDLTQVLIGTNTVIATNQNPRRIAFLEVPNEFTFQGGGDPNARGIVTPVRFYRVAQSNFSVSVDHDYDGRITVTNGTVTTNLAGSVAVWFVDPRVTNTTVGTWR